jgi:hypothetical protein
MRKTASEYYSQRRGNCAQAVAHAWKTKNPASPHDAAQFADCGGGRAPDGVCGALHASCMLAGAGRAGTIREKFAEQAGGHIECRAIRASKALPCQACVALAAELLERA